MEERREKCEGKFQRRAKLPGIVQIAIPESPRERCVVHFPLSANYVVDETLGTGAAKLGVAVFARKISLIPGSQQCLSSWKETSKISGEP
jgi:hypothetical protein